MPSFRKGNLNRYEIGLHEHIHRPGQCYTSSDELIQRVTGKPLSHVPLMNYLKRKYGALYGL